MKDSQPSPSPKPAPSAEETLYEVVAPHLVELRTRLIRGLVALVAVALLLLPWANDLYTLIAHPWLSTLPDGSQLIATQVASPILVPLKTALVLALLLCAPYIFYQAWAFIAPGLYPKERRLAAPLTLASVGLFYTGALFAFLAVFPIVFRFINFVNPEGVAIMTDISHYLNFVLSASFAFGIAFQVPVAVVALATSGAVSIATLAHLRPYIIVGAFIVGMLLTPPDVVSQIMLAVPIWLLYEAGLLVSRRMGQSARMPPAGADPSTKEKDDTAPRP